MTVDSNDNEIARGLSYFLAAFKSKRFANRIQEEAVTRLVIAHGYDKFKEAVDWAAKLGFSRGRAVVSLETALPKWRGNGKPKPAGERDPQSYVTGAYADWIISGREDEDDR